MSRVGREATNRGGDGFFVLLYTYATVLSGVAFYLFALVIFVRVV